MTSPVTARGDRVLGRGLLALANVITVAAPVAADWNDSHIFNSRWPGHARFHGVTALTMATTLSALNVWSVCSGRHDRDTVRFFAAAVPVAYWAPFFVAPLVPGTAVDDPPHQVRRIAGAPVSLLGAAATTATAAAGWFIDRRSAAGSSRPARMGSASDPRPVPATDDLIGQGDEASHDGDESSTAGPR